MKVGDLVLKVGGWGATAVEDFTGLVINIKVPEPFYEIAQKKVVVMTDEGIEEWYYKFCEVISEDR